MTSTRNTTDHPLHMCGKCEATQDDLMSPDSLRLIARYLAREIDCGMEKDDVIESTVAYGASDVYGCIDCAELVTRHMMADIGKGVLIVAADMLDSACVGKLEWVRGTVADAGIDMFWSVDQWGRAVGSAIETLADHVRKSFDVPPHASQGPCQGESDNVILWVEKVVPTLPEMAELIYGAVTANFPVRN